MITKTKFWNTIRNELKEAHRSQQITENVMKIIKDTLQDETNNKRDPNRGETNGSGGC